MVLSGENIVKRIDDLLDSKGLKRPDACRYAKINLRALTDWDKKGTIPAADTLYSSAVFLQTTVEHLLTGKEPQGIPQKILETARKIASLPLQDQEEIIGLLEIKLKKHKREGKNMETMLVKEPEPAYLTEISVHRPPEFDNNVASISFDMTYIPFYGLIAAGKPIDFLVPVNKVISVPSRLLKGNKSHYFAVQVKGNSMINEDIKNGDLVVFRYAEVPVDGHIMLVEHENQSTVKRLRKIDGQWNLCWEDGTGEKLPVNDENYKVQGEYVCIIRE
jgi:repressor LexA